MGIVIGTPQPPKIEATQFLVWLTLGLSLILVITWLADMVGTAMYRRGFAKPFYVLGRRVHHSCIYLIVPASYLILGTLYLLGYVQVIWGSLWTNLAYAAIITSLVMAADFLGDRYWPRIRKKAVLHHEWIYTLLPAFIFTYVVHITL